MVAIHFFIIYDDDAVKSRSTSWSLRTIINIIIILADGGGVRRRLPVKKGMQKQTKDCNAIHVLVADKNPVHTVFNTHLIE